MEQHPSSKIDELLRHRLRDAEVPPPAFVWPNVAQALRRRKRRGLFWLPLLGAFALAGWGLWRLSESSTFVQQNSVLQKNTTAGAPAPAVSNDATAAAAQTTPNAAAGTSASLETGAADPSQAHREPALGQFSQKGMGKRPSVSLPTLHARPGAPPPAAVQVPTEKPVAQAPAENAVATTEASIERMAPLAFLPPVQPSATVPQPPAPLALASAKKQTRKCYDFHRNRQAWLLDAYAGPSFGRKRLFPGDSEFEAYAQDRLTTEQREASFHAGLRVSYLFAESFMLRTGLHYDQLVERFEFIDPKYIKYTVVIKQVQVNGQWVSVADTVNVEYGANYVKTYNRYGFLDIPLQAALELRSGATGISLNLGGSVNLLFQKRGSILSENGLPAVFTPGKKDSYEVFRTRVGLSLIGSIQWFYHFDARTRAFVEPYYRHILNPVTRPDYPVEQFYGVGGIRFGVTRILDKN